jgi:uncharacterized protein YigE (DUF2233 family)
VVENFSKLSLALFVFLISEVSIRAESAPCQPVAYEHSEYTVCEVDLRRQSVRLFWKKPDGYPYEYLSSLPRALGNSRHLLFATNGGMYHPDNSPVGLYVEEGRELVRVNTSAGPGNFHMRPNGVFYVTGEVAGVLETRSFIKSSRAACKSRTGTTGATSSNTIGVGIVVLLDQYLRCQFKNRSNLCRGFVRGAFRGKGL